MPAPGGRGGRGYRGRGPSVNINRFEQSLLR